MAVDLDEALAFSAVGDGGGCLLLAEALNALGGRHDCGLCLIRAGGIVVGVLRSFEVRDGEVLDVQNGCGRQDSQ